MKYLILDSNIVIDYVKADKTLFSLISQYVGEVFFADQMTPEVRQIQGFKAYSELGIQIATVEIDDLAEARERGKHGDLSEFDWICFLVAKRLGYCCVTNDSGLRKQCMKEDVETIRGGGLIVELCRRGGITKERAKEIGFDIVNASKWSRRQSWFDDFLNAINEI